MTALLLLFILQTVSVYMNEDAFNAEVIKDIQCYGQDMLTREACPEGYENKSVCLDKQCCWDDLSPEGYNCFRPRDVTKKTQCNALYSQRMSCTNTDRYGAYLEVSEESCVKQGCCYDETVSMHYLIRKTSADYFGGSQHVDFREIRKIQMDVIRFLRKNPVPQCYLKKNFYDGRCAVPNEERRPCGNSIGNVTYDDCMNYNCCYSKVLDNEMHCFKKDYKYDTNIECRLNYQDSLPMYQYGKNDIACLSAGYCFESPNICYMGISSLAEHHRKLEIERQNYLKGVPIRGNDVSLPASQNPVEFCWTTTYGRGVGLIPAECGELDKQGLLCYPKCASGYSGVLFVCWQDCPAGFADHGAFCFKPPPYGRGVGYPWKFGDAFNDNGMYRRCMSDNSALGCEKWGLVYYPKCKKGYHSVGCCICSPDCKDGQVDIGISCAKKSYVRETILPKCESYQEYDAGLCYKKCDKGYNGIGPVCWGSCPEHAPVSCGMACAKDYATCQNNIFGQITSAVDVFVNIASTVASAGTSLAAASAIKSSAKLAAKSALNKVTKLVTKEGVEKALKLVAKETGEHLSEVALKEAAFEVAEVVTPENELEWQDFDPTGIANAIRFYNHPVCKYD